MKLTRAEIAALQRAEQYRGAAKRAIDNDETVDVVVKLPKKKAVTVRMEKTNPGKVA